MSSPFGDLNLPPPSPEQKRRATWGAISTPIIVVAVIVALVVVIGVGVAFLSGDSLHEFSSAEGKFRVQMPESPKQKNATHEGATLKTFMVEEKNGAYLVSFMDLPFEGDTPPELIEKVLDAARDGGAGFAQGQVTGDKKIKLADKYPGREVTCRIPAGVTRARFYIVGKRSYTILVTGTSDWVNSTNPTKFLDSFQLIE